MNIILSILIIITSFQPLLAQQNNDIEFVSINKTKTNFNTIVNENELTVFVFYSTECPICIKSLKSLKKIMLDFDINYYFVYPTETNSKKGIKKFHKINNLSQLL
jgi:glutaredoxin-related protein